MKCAAPAVAMFAGLFCVSAQAGITTLDAVKTGWYAHDGQHDTYNTNYAVGGGADGLTRNDFFIFDLSGLSGVASAATLKIFNPGVASTPGVPFGYTSSDAAETYRLVDVSTGPSMLSNSYGSGSLSGKAIYADLGNGASYGEYQASLVDNGHFIEISLNAAGLGDLNNSLDRYFSIGGTVTTLDGVLNKESIFASTLLYPGAVQLVVTTVPEPEEAILMLAGLTLVGAMARRNKRRE